MRMWQAEGLPWSLLTSSEQVLPEYFLSSSGDSVVLASHVSNGRTPSNSDPVLKAYQRSQFFKTRICPHFKKYARCRKAEECNYAHTSEELRPSVNLTKTKLCQDHMHGSCSKSTDACPFAHGLVELRSTPGFYKTQMCKFWMAGHCPSGSLCRHAHGDTECRINRNSGFSPTGSASASVTKQDSFTLPNSITLPPSSDRAASSQPPPPPPPPPPAAAHFLPSFDYAAAVAAANPEILAGLLHQQGHYLPYSLSTPARSEGEAAHFQLRGSSSAVNPYEKAPPSGAPSGLQSGTVSPHYNSMDPHSPTNLHRFGQSHQSYPSLLSSTAVANAVAVMMQQSQGGASSQAHREETHVVSSSGASTTVLSADETENDQSASPNCVTAPAERDAEKGRKNGGASIGPSSPCVVQPSSYASSGSSTNYSVSNLEDHARRGNEVYRGVELADDAARCTPPVEQDDEMEPGEILEEPASRLINCDQQESGNLSSPISTAQTTANVAASAPTGDSFGAPEDHAKDDHSTEASVKPKQVDVDNQAHQLSDRRLSGDSAKSDKPKAGPAPYTFSVNHARRLSIKDSASKRWPTPSPGVPSDQLELPVGERVAASAPVSPTLNSPRNSPPRSSAPTSPRTPPANAAAPPASLMELCQMLTVAMAPQHDQAHQMQPHLVSGGHQHVPLMQYPPTGPAPQPASNLHASSTAEGYGLHDSYKYSPGQASDPNIWLSALQQQVEAAVASGEMRANLCNPHVDVAPRMAEPLSPQGAPTRDLAGLGQSASTPPSTAALAAGAAFGVPPHLLSAVQHIAGTIAMQRQQQYAPQPVSPGVLTPPQQAGANVKYNEQLALLGAALSAAAVTNAPPTLLPPPKLTHQLEMPQPIPSGNTADWNNNLNNWLGSMMRAASSRGSGGTSPSPADDQVLAQIRTLMNATVGGPPHVPSPVTGPQSHVHPSHGGLPSAPYGYHPSAQQQKSVAPEAMTSNGLDKVLLLSSFLQQMQQRPVRYEGCSAAAPDPSSELPQQFEHLNPAQMQGLVAAVFGAQSPMSTYEGAWHRENADETSSKRMLQPTASETPSPQ